MSTPAAPAAPTLAKPSGCCPASCCDFDTIYAGKTLSVSYSSKPWIGMQSPFRTDITFTGVYVPGSNGDFLGSGIITNYYPNQQFVQCPDLTWRSPFTSTFSSMRMNCRTDNLLFPLWYYLTFPVTVPQNFANPVAVIGGCVNTPTKSYDQVISIDSLASSCFGISCQRKVCYNGHWAQNCADPVSLAASYSEDATLIANIS